MRSLPLLLALSACAGVASDAEAERAYLGLEDAVVGPDDAVITTVYDTEPDAPLSLDLSLRKIPNGTLTGAAVASEDVLGNVVLDLTIAGELEPAPAPPEGGCSSSPARPRSPSPPTSASTTSTSPDRGAAGGRDHPLPRCYAAAMPSLGARSTRKDGPWHTTSSSPS